MNRDRTILHCDVNNFYASVECLYEPALKGRPMAVAGDPDARHGIVLAKNELAKTCGVKTGEALWQAKRKCPNIVFVHPRHALYEKFSHMASKIYADYTDLIEPFGLDESWLDVTSGEKLFGDGKTVADALRERIKRELGLTISVGVSFNKIFAKLGSDMKKPDATTVIKRDTFRNDIWPLPVNELLYVGPSTLKKLNHFGIYTIGQLAAADMGFLRSLFGKSGAALWQFANGLDDSPVKSSSETVKSVGNSTTLPRDIHTAEEAEPVLLALCESVSSRLRKQELVCRTVQIFVRDCNFTDLEMQGKLDAPCRTVKALFEKSNELFLSCRRPSAIRSLGVRATELSSSRFQQLSLFPETNISEKLDCTVELMRAKFGGSCILRACALTEPELIGIGRQREENLNPIR